MIIHKEPPEDFDIACDECGVLAPPAKEIMAGHGLNRMGWDCHGGTHLCPNHNPRQGQPTC